MSRRRAGRALWALLLLDGAAIGAVFPFLTVMLQSRGFDAFQIGLITAASSTAFTVALPAWGHVADTILGRVRALQIAGLGAGLALLVFLGPLPALALAACIVVFTILEAPVAALSDALVVNAVSDPARSYPRLRVLFSLAMAVTTIGLGIVLERTGYGAVPIFYALAIVGVAITAGLVPDVARATLEHDGSVRGGAVRAAYAAQPRLPIILLAVGLAFFGVTVSINFLPLRLAQLGGGPTDVALSSGLASLAEIPASLVAGWIAARGGLRGLFVLSTLLYAAALASWVVIDSIGVIIATRAVTGAAFAGLFVAIVLTMQSTLPERLQGTGQGLFQATAFGAAAIVADVVGGILFASVGAASLFALAASLSVLAVVVGWVALPVRATATEPLALPIVPG